MNDETYSQLVLVIGYIALYIEGVCGEKSMRRILASLTVLNNKALTEVLAGIHNRIRPDNKVRMGHVHKAELPILKAQSKRIFKLLLASKRNLSTLDDEIIKYFERRMKYLNSKKA
jgi:hypothetical protein